MSLAQGAIRGWDNRTPYYFSMLTSLARHYHFDIETPFNSLPKKIQNIILYGSGDDEIVFNYILGNFRRTRKQHAFEGIIPNMERRYRDTESVAVREDLAKFLTLT